jgi:hypothetical protein
MKLWLVCYANRKFVAPQRWLVQSAQRFGFDEIRAYQECDLRRTEFFRRHRDVLTARRGAGYWLWKPYYIAQVLREAAPGDVVAYVDSGIELIADLRPLVDICLAGRGITLFQVHDGFNIIWTKRSCMAGMNCDEPRYHWAQQVAGGLQLYRHCSESFDFLRQWFDDCCQPQLLTDSPNPPGMENYPEFRDHRHDQSIASLLATRWELPIYRCPSQWGNTWALPEFRPPGTKEFPNRVPYQNSPYGQLVDHHRRNRAARHRHQYDLVRQAMRPLRQLIPWRRAA